MGNRLDALWRVLGLVWLFIVTPILFSIGIIAGLIWMAVDVVLQLVTGGEGLSSGSGGVSSWLMRLFDYPVDQIRFILFGSDEFPLLP